MHVHARVHVALCGVRPRARGARLASALAWPLQRPVRDPLRLVEVAELELARRVLGVARVMLGVPRAALLRT